MVPLYVILLKGNKTGLSLNVANDIKKNFTRSIEGWLADYLSWAECNPLLQVERGGKEGGVIPSCFPAQTSSWEEKIVFQKFQEETHSSRVWAANANTG